MKQRSAPWLISLAAATVIGSGCGPQPDPAPSHEEEMAPVAAFTTDINTVDTLLAMSPSTVQKGPWGSLTVRARFEGAAPDRPALSVTTDRWLCGLHELRSDRLVVDPDGGIKDVVAFIDGPRGYTWSDSLTFAGFGPTRLLDQVGCRFDPHVLIVQAGQSFQIRNSDPVLHNARGSEHPTNNLKPEKPNRGFNLAMPRKNQEIQRTIKRVGVVSIACDVHAWMNAYVVALPNPYGTVTTADGTGRIDGIPVGTRTVHFWHETLGEKSMSVDITTGTNEVSVAWGP